MNEDTTLPDFEIWANKIIAESAIINAQTLTQSIAHAIAMGFTQGRTLGYREGYQIGLDKGWGLEQDKAHDA